MNNEHDQNMLNGNDKITTPVIKEEETFVDSFLADSQNIPENGQTNDLQIKDEQTIIENCNTNCLDMREEVQTTNIITIRIKKKRGEPRRSDPYRLYTPDLFQSLFGFSIFNCQRDSEWREILKKKQGSLFFNSNGIRIRDPLIDTKPLKSNQRKSSKKKLHRKKNAQKKIFDMKMNQKFKQKVFNVKAYSSHVQEVSTGGCRLFQCEFCYLRFKERRSCTRHMDQVHLKIRNYKCDHCNQTFYAHGGLKKHVESVHLKLKPFKCELCEKSFSTPNTLKVHHITHEKTAQYECPTCGKKIRHKQTYDEHLNIHNNVKFTCTKCNKSYSTKKVLRHHILTHDPINEINCSKCNRSFVDRYSLKKHERYFHSSVFYECNICQKSFLARNNLRKHIENVHGCAEKSLKCKYCNALFKNIVYMNNHLTRMHTETIHCFHCPTTFPNKDRLLYHLKSKHGTFTYKPFKCSLCDKHFIRKNHVKRHMKSHVLRANKSNLNLSCDKCGKKYKLEIALQKHNLICK